MTKRKVIGWIIAIVAVWLLIWALPRLGMLYIDWQWFGEVGYRVIFARTLWAKIGVGALFGAIFFIIVYGNILLAQRLAPRAAWYEFESQVRQKIAYELERFVERWLGRLALALTLLISYGVAKQAATRWLAALAYANPTEFGRTDPLFGKDLSFYVFQLPFLETMQNYVAGALFAALLLSAGVHYLGKAIRTVRGIPAFAPHVKVHLSILAAGLFLVKAWDYKLQAYRLLYSDTGYVFGATYADVHAGFYALTALLVIAVICALAVLVNLRVRGFAIPIWAVIVLMISSVLGGIYPIAIQRYKVKPSEQTVEAEYITRNIEATRFGFGLEGVQDMTFPSMQPYRSADLKNEQETIQNVRLWDHRPLRSAYKQKQQLQPYYRFNEDYSGVDIDRYTINGDYRQVMLAARELSFDDLPAKGWQNEHIFYTHGYGLVLSPVNEATRVGEPRLLVRDIPPVSDGLPEITRPEIYYGEIARPGQFSLVQTNMQEIDYPLTGQLTAKTTYQGKGGVPIGSSLMRMLMSMRFGLIDFILSENITEDTRIIFRRSVRERLRTIAPFLVYDYDPYMVISESGRLYWIQDAYTVSRQLPYSQPYALFPQGGTTVNYIRNSVKVVIDAYDGTTQFFIADEKDPLLGTLGKIFPDVFLPMSQMPENLLEHIRYPEQLFNLQARVLSVYHMRDVEQFYHKTDKWQIATEMGGKQVSSPSPYSNRATSSDEETMEAYYTMMRLPGEEKAEFILMIPFNPVERQNMVAWMAARCDPEHYGELITHEFSRAQQVYGPVQFEAGIDADQDLSKLFSLWDQRGSDVVRGNLLVLPLGQSILYVEPIFLRAEVAPIPQLKLVVVGRQQGDELRVFFAPTLRRALAIAVGDAPRLSAEELLEGLEIEELPDEAEPRVADGEPQPAESTVSQARVKRALEHFDRAQRHLRAGDLAGYEKELEKMEAVLREMAR